MVSFEYKITFAAAKDGTDSWDVLVWERHVVNGGETLPWTCMLRRSSAVRPWAGHHRRDLMNAVKSLAR